MWPFTVVLVSVDTIAALRLMTSVLIDSREFHCCLGIVKAVRTGPHNPTNR